MSKYGIGQPVLRFEDPRLLRGQGRYINDVNLPGQAYAVFVRSPHAHAKINAIDIEEAKKGARCRCRPDGPRRGGRRPRHAQGQHAAQAARR
jgi:hypothetical protein